MRTCFGTERDGYRKLNTGNAKNIVTGNQVGKYHELWNANGILCGLNQVI